MSTYLSYFTRAEDTFTFGENKFVEVSTNDFMTWYCYGRLGEIIRGKDTVYTACNLGSRMQGINNWDGKSVSIKWIRTVKAYLKFCREVFDMPIHMAKCKFSNMTVYLVRVGIPYDTPADKAFTALCFTRFVCPPYSHKFFSTLYNNVMTPLEYIKLIHENGAHAMPADWPVPDIYKLFKELKKDGLVKYQTDFTILRDTFVPPFGDAVYSFMKNKIPSRQWRGLPFQKGLNHMNRTYLQDAWSEHLKDFYRGNIDVQNEVYVDEDYSWED